MIGYIYHDLFVRHLEGYPHVERPERLEAINKKIRQSPIADKISFIEARPAKREWLEKVHNRKYIEDVITLDIKNATVLDWGDTVATPATPQAALYAAGAGVLAVQKVLDGELTSAFCAVRPPGHHAEEHRAMGFCIFNNIAIAAAYLLDEGGLKRVAIVDWDIHHGNGTERTFMEDGRVLYISLHQHPHYPGTGQAEMVGRGEGTGFTLNIPMGAGAGDREYFEAFDQKVIPATDKFKPEFILISAGFDGHIDDPLSGTFLSTESFGKMTTMLKEAAEKHCKGRIVSFLEGGYNLNALSDSVEEHLKALAGDY